MFMIIPGTGVHGNQAASYINAVYSLYCVELVS